MKKLFSFAASVLAVLLIAGCATVLPPVEPVEPPPPEVVEEPVIPPPDVIEEPEIPPPPEVVEEPEPPVEAVPEPPPVPEPVYEQLVLLLTSGAVPSYSKTASLRDELSIASPAVLIDRGSTFASYPFADTDEGEGIITLMNALSYDAMALGIKDFFHDAPRLRSLIDMASFPVFSTHILGSETLLSSAVLDAGGISVALFSVVDPESFASLHPTLTSGFTAEDPVELVHQEVMDAVKEGADLIILFSEADLFSLEISDELMPWAFEILDAASLIVQKQPMNNDASELPWIISTDASLMKITIHLEDRTVTSIETDYPDYQSVESDAYIASIEQAVRQSQGLIKERALEYAVDGSLKAPDRYGLYPLMNALQYDEPPTVIGVLLSEGASAAQRDDFGMTPLMYASWMNSHPRVITRLIREGSSPDERDDEGWTPLMRAVLNEHIEIMETIIESGADINEKNREGWTPLMFAAGFGSDARFTEALIQFGADLDVKSDEGMTALMYAAGFNSDPEIISVLLDAGADADIRDDFQTNALEYAQGNRSIRDTWVMEKLEKATSR